MAETRKRSIAKAISWRATGTLDTFVISFVITGHAAAASGIAVTEVLTKTFLYYLHERAWAFVRRHRPGPDSHRRSLTKAISWRATATLDTFVISWLITGHAATAGGIAATEVATKILLFYLHERTWARVAWGRHAPDVALATGTASIGAMPMAPEPLPARQ
jgi:uncharacterized membrane protein